MTMTSLDLTHFLQVQGYTSVEQMLGYSSAIDVNNMYNLQPYRQPDSKKNGVAAPACDFDHCPGRPIREIISHTIEAGFPCALGSLLRVLTYAIRKEGSYREEEGSREGS